MFDLWKLNSHNTLKIVPGLAWWPVVKSQSAKAEDTGSIPDVGRSHMPRSTCGIAAEPAL